MSDEQPCLEESMEAMESISDGYPGDPHEGTAYWQVVVEHIEDLEHKLKGWPERHFNDVMAAKKSGWDDAVLFHKDELDAMDEARTAIWEAYYCPNHLAKDKPLCTKCMSRLEEFLNVCGKKPLNLRKACGEHGL